MSSTRVPLRTCRCLPIRRGNEACQLGADKDRVRIKTESFLLLMLRYQVVLDSQTQRYKHPINQNRKTVRSASGIGLFRSHLQIVSESFSYIHLYLYLSISIIYSYASSSVLLYYLCPMNKLTSHNCKHQQLFPTESCFKSKVYRQLTSIRAQPHHIESPPSTS